MAAVRSDEPESMTTISSSIGTRSISACLKVRTTFPMVSCSLRVGSPRLMVKPWRCFSHDGLAYRAGEEGDPPDRDVDRAGQFEEGGFFPLAGIGRDPGVDDMEDDQLGPAVLADGGRQAQRELGARTAAHRHQHAA